ncbi:helix-turn-helix transcriptional regulator [Tumebacillus sp. ITR2]|uniref:Helix-turn-helix transcriptional regulator n=1 Tax=Tumebacillus amylolyticus TaxID=2801339 RepID=A0ABS1J6S6_9BACL|nr:helix-turn-helix transcriptional regulator [Tumebacillus amylolyticus]MBL0385880.1 helix-turn-helix transcriptional regulator [Tumebacillus amylolyticus]
MLTFYQLVGKRILEEMERRGFKQQDLADKLGYSKQVMSKVLRGEKNTTILEMTRIAEILGVTVDSLSRPNECESSLYDLEEDLEPTFMGQVRTEQGRAGVQKALRIISLLQQQEKIREHKETGDRSLSNQIVDFSWVKRWEE